MLRGLMQLRRPSSWPGKSPVLFFVLVLAAKTIAEHLPEPGILPGFLPLLIRSSFLLLPGSRLPGHSRVARPRCPVGRAVRGLGRRGSDLLALEAGALHLQVPPSAPCWLFLWVLVNLKITFLLGLIVTPRFIWVATIED